MNQELSFYVSDIILMTMELKNIVLVQFVKSGHPSRHKLGHMFLLRMTLKHNIVFIDIMFLCFHRTDMAKFRNVKMSLRLRIQLKNINVYICLFAF